MLVESENELYIINLYLIMCLFCLLINDFCEFTIFFTLTQTPENREHHMDTFPCKVEASIFTSFAVASH